MTTHLPNLAVGSPLRVSRVRAAPAGVLPAAAGSFAVLRPPPDGGFDGDDLPKGCSPCDNDPTAQCRHGRQLCSLPGRDPFYRCCPPPPPVCEPCQRTCTAWDGSTYQESCGRGPCCAIES